MKKFSSQINRDINVKFIPTKMNETLSKIIDETLNTKIKNEDLITKDIVLEGKSELIDKLIDLINSESKKSNDALKENFKSKYINYVDMKEINSVLENLQKKYNDIVSIPSPKDIFSTDDYTTFGDEIVLESLNNIPSIFEQYLNIDNVINYFEQGNILKTRYIGPKEGWKLSFEGNLSIYGTNVSSDEEKFKIFVNNNKDFITSIYEATSSLIGDKILINQKYISNILGL